MPTPPTTAVDRANAIAYTLITGIGLVAVARVTGPAAYAVCTVIALVYGVAAALASRGGPTYGRVRVPLTVGLRIAFVALHNVAIVLSAGPRRALPDPTWRWFWTTRTGPINVFILNAAPGLPRGRALAAMLTGQAAAVALTQRPACVHLLRAYPLLAFFYSRLVDVWGAVGRASVAAVLGGWTGGDDGGGGLARVVPPPPGSGAGAPTPAAAALSPAALAECATHACTFVMTLLYTGVGGLTWLLAPRGHERAGGAATTPRLPPRRRRRPADIVDAAVAGGLAAASAVLVAWVGLVLLLPRPPCCAGGVATAAAWEAIGRKEGL